MDVDDLEEMEKVLVQAGIRQATVQLIMERERKQTYAYPYLTEYANYGRTRRCCCTEDQGQYEAPLIVGRHLVKQCQSCGQLAFGYTGRDEYSYTKTQHLIAPLRCMFYFIGAFVVWAPQAKNSTTYREVYVEGSEFDPEDRVLDTAPMLRPLAVCISIGGLDRYSSYVELQEYGVPMVYVDHKELMRGGDLVRRPTRNDRSDHTHVPRGNGTGGRRV